MNLLIHPDKRTVRGIELAGGTGSCDLAFQIVRQALELGTDVLKTVAPTPCPPKPSPSSPSQYWPRAAPTTPMNYGPSVYKAAPTTPTNYDSPIYKAVPMTPPSFVSAPTTPHSYAPYTS